MQTGTACRPGEVQGTGAKMGILLLSHALNDGYIILLTPILPVLASEFHLDPIAMGLIISVNSFTTTVLQLPASFVADYTGRKKTLLALGLLVLGLGVLLYGLSPTYGILLAGAFLVGAGGSTYHPTSMGVITDEFEKERKGFYLGIHTPAGSLGASLMPALMGFAVASIGWRAAALILAPVAMALGGLIYFFFRDVSVNQGKGGSVKSGFTWEAMKRDILLNPPLLLLAGIGGINAFAYYGAITFLPSWVSEAYGWDSARAGALMALFHGVALASQPLLGFLSDRYGRSRPLAGAMALGAVAIALLVFLPGTSRLVFMAALWGATVLAIRPVIFAGGTDYTSAATSSTTIGLIFAANSAFGSLAPILGGYLARAFSLQVSFLLFASFMAIGTVLTFLLPQSCMRPLSKRW